VVVGLREALTLDWPAIHGRIAWQEATTAITCCSLEVSPIDALADLVPTCDHEPLLASMVSTQLHPSLHVRARCDLRNGDAGSIVPLLPNIQASGMHVGLGTARCSRGVQVPCRTIAIGGGEWLIAEIIRKTLWVVSMVVPQLELQVVLAHRLRQPPMASCLREEERRGNALQHGEW